MALSAIVLLCLLALGSAAPQHDSLSRSRRETMDFDTIMSEICTLSQEQGNKKLASLVAEATELFRNLPENILVDGPRMIRAGEFCADYSKLESLFLDAVAFVDAPGAFKVMAQEIAAGRTTGGRLGLYTVALNLLTEPSLDHVAALTPIFEMENSYQLVSLAASVVVNRYCSQDGSCDQAEPVNHILNQLSNKLKTQCTPDFSKQDTLQVLTTLKSVGNIGKFSPDMFDDVMKCVSTEGIETNVRFAAVMSLKGASCKNQFIKTLMSKALGNTFDSTEVRIGSYLAAVRCAQAEDFETVINAMASERNDQVKGFILSHLENLQETNWPLKQTLREILESYDIPSNYMNNIFKYSRNVELSANSRALDVGGLIESNVIYTPESYVPRLVNLGLNMNLLGSFINIGEVGARLEGFEELDHYIKVMENIFQQPLWSTIEELKIFMTDNGKEILQQIQKLVKENKINPDSIIKALDRMTKNSKNFNIESFLIAFNDVLKKSENIDINSILKMVDFDSVAKYIRNYVNNNKFQLPKTDLYAILRAQERVFLSFGGEKHQFTIKQLFESVIPIIVNALSSAQELNVDTSRMGQFNIDYTLPSINGKPLRLRLKGTGVVGIQLKNNLNVKSGAIDALLKIIPSFSGQLEGQISYGENEGIKLKGNLYTTNGFALNVAQKGKDLELQVDLPAKMELINIEIETDNTSDKDIRIKDNQCIGIIESVTGLLVCYEINVPDLMKTNKLPIGKPLAFRVYFEKSDPAMKGYRLAAKLKNKPNNMMLKIAAGTYGSTDSKESSLTLSYTKQEDTYIWSTKFQSSLIESTNELTFINQPEYKSLQYYCSDTIGTGIDVEGSVKIDFKALSVSNGDTFEVAVYTGLAKVLKEKNRVFQVIFSLLENGDKTAATFLTKTDLFPVTFEAGIELPHNAGLRIYKVEGLTLRSTVSFVEVEALFRKKSSEVYETILNIKKSRTVLATFSAANTISIESPLTGFEAFKLKLMTRTKAKFPMTEFEFNAKFSYENGVIDTVTQIRYNDSGISTIKSNLSYTETGIELSAKASCLDAICFSSNILHNLDITAPVMEIQIGVPAADSNLVSRLSYVDGLVDASTEVTFLESVIFNAYFKKSLNGLPITSQTMIEVPSVFLIDISHTIDSTGLSTEAEVKAPGIIKPLRINNVFVITDVFSYSVLTEILSNNEVALRAEGPLTFTFSTSMIQEKLNVEISGAFDGAFNIIHECTFSLEKNQYIINIIHTNTPIMLFDLTSERTKPGEISGKGNLYIPFVVSSEQKVSITASEELIYLYIFEDTLVLPNTDYAHKYKGYIDFTLKGNMFETTHDWDIRKWEEDVQTDKIVGHKGTYTLEWPTFKFLVKGDIWALALNYVYKLESNLASPLEWFQGNSGLEITIKEYTPDISGHELAVMKSMVDIQYTESQISITPSFTIRTDFENNFELDEKLAISSSLVAKRLPTFLNFDVVYEATLTAAQLQPINLVSKLSHEHKDAYGKLLFRVTLKESVLNEECSFVYVLESKPTLLNRNIRLQYGPNIVKLTTEIVPPRWTSDPFIALRANTGEPFGITFWNTYELSLPLQNVQSLKVKLSADTGLIELAFLKNEKNVVKIYYSKPSIISLPSLFVNHIVGIESNSRTVEFRSELKDNQLSFKILPELNKGDRALEASLRVIPKASATQFEASITAPSLPKEMRFAVKLELFENTKDKSDQVMVHIQYQVSGAPKLFKASLNELQSIYADFVSDGLLPDINELYKISQNMLKQLPEAINDIQDQLTVVLINFYYYCYHSVSNVYLLYEADLIALWRRIQSDVPMYLNIIKTKVPAFFKNYMEIIKNTETWKAIQTTLNKIMANYTTFYDYIIEFYNKVIVKYLTNLSKTVSKLLALSKSDVDEYLAIVQKEVSTIFNNVVFQFKKTQLFRLLQDKYYELNSKVVQFLRRYPAVYDYISELYEKVILSTFKDIISSIQNIIGGPLDFQRYSEIIKADLPTLVMDFVNRVLEIQIAKDIKAAYPIVFDVVIDFNNIVILTTYDDVDTFVQELISIPISENLVLSWQTVDVLKKVPALLYNFGQRISTTQLVTELKTLLPTFSKVAEDFYKVVLLPTAQDIKAFLTENFSVPLGDIYVYRDKYWELIKVEIPSLMIKFIQRIPNTQAINLLRTNFDKLSSMAQSKFEELKAQYPELYAVGFDFYTKVVKPAIDDVPILYNKIIGITDPNQLRDFVTTDIIVFLKKMIANLTTTDLFNKILPVLDQLADANPDIYNSFIKLYNDIAQLEARDVILAIDSYLIDNFGMSFSFSAGKFTAILPLPIKAETVRNSVPFVFDFMESSLHFSFQVYRYCLFMGQQIYEYIGFQLLNYRPYLQYAFEFVQELPFTITKLVDDILDSLPEDDDEFFDNLEEMIENFLSTPYGKVTEQILEKVFELLMTTYTELAERYPKEIGAFNDFLSLSMEKLENFIDFAIYRIVEIMVSIEIYQDLYEDFIEEYLDTAITGIVDHPLVQKIINYISTLTIEKVQFDLRSLFLFAMQSIEDLTEALPTEVISFISLHIPNFELEYRNVGFFIVYGIAPNWNVNFNHEI